MEKDSGITHYFFLEVVLLSFTTGLQAHNISNTMVFVFKQLLHVIAKSNQRSVPVNMV